MLFCGVGSLVHVWWMAIMQFSTRAPQGRQIRFHSLLCVIMSAGAIQNTQQFEHATFLIQPVDVSSGEKRTCSRLFAMLLPGFSGEMCWIVIVLTLCQANGSNPGLWKVVSCCVGAFDTLQLSYMYWREPVFLGDELCSGSCCVFCMKCGVRRCKYALHYRFWQS